MTSRMIAKTVPTLTLLSLLALGLAACGGGDTKAPPPPPPPAAPAAMATEETLVQTPDGQVVVTFRVSAEEILIVFTDDGQERVLRSGLNTSRRQRAYTERGSGPVALVRANKTGKTFTVRSPDGELRWRVRLAKNISVGDHPTQSAFELRPTPGQLVRVRAQDGADLGQAALEGSLVEVRDAQGGLVYKGKGRGLSSLYGVPLVPDLEPIERYVLMAELLVRKR